MQEVFFLSSMDSRRFSSVFRCEVVRPIELPNGHHALMVSCDPPLKGQELGHPLGISELLLCSRFYDEDLRTFPAFPHFVQICLPDADLPADVMPASIAWGEIYKTEADAHAHEMSARPSTEAPRDTGPPRGARTMNELTVEDVPLLLVGETVDAIWVDYALRLLFSNGATVILECPFSLGRSPDAATMIDPEGDKLALVPALRLHTLEVTAAHATGSTLTMTFSDGSRLIAEPHPEFESWHYFGPESPPTMIVMMPGGGPAIWLHHEETEQEFVSFRTRATNEHLLPAFHDVFTSLTVPPLRWLVTDLDIVMRSGSTVNVHEWDRRLRAAPPPGLWFSHEEMLTLVRDNDQLIDGEFFGVPLGAGADPARAVLRIDFFDSGEATVVLDPSVIGVSEAFERLFGPAVEVPSIGSRNADNAAYRVQSLLLAFLDTLPARRTAALRQQAEAVQAVHEAAPRIWDVVLAETPRADFPDGPLPGSLAYRTDEAPLAGEVLVWMLDGRIDSVELPWFTTEMPAGLPRPEQLIRTAIEGDGDHGVR